MTRAHRISARILVAVIAVGCFAFLSCSSSRPGSEGDDLDPAIALFLDEQYEQAIAAFTRLLEESGRDETRREIYYYLGRSYLELGETRSAIDAFTAGVQLGDRGPCLEYLNEIRSGIEGVPRSVRLRPEVSRRQLAALVIRWLDGAPEAVTRPVKDPLEAAWEYGWVTRLPDGDLHHDAFVSRASFYVFVARMCADVDCSVPVRDVLGSYPRSDEPIPGPEIIAALERLIPWKFPDGG